MPIMVKRFLCTVLFDTRRRRHKPDRQTNSLLLEWRRNGRSCCWRINFSRAAHWVNIILATSPATSVSGYVDIVCRAAGPNRYNQENNQRDHDWRTCLNLVASLPEYSADFIYGADLTARDPLFQISDSHCYSQPSKVKRWDYCQIKRFLVRSAIQCNNLIGPSWLTSELPEIQIMIFASKLTLRPSSSDLPPANLSNVYSATLDLLGSGPF